MPYTPEPEYESPHGALFIILDALLWLIQLPMRLLGVVLSPFFTATPSPEMVCPPKTVYQCSAHGQSACVLEHHAHV